MSSLILRFFQLILFLISVSVNAADVSIQAYAYYFDYEEFDDSDGSLNNETGHIPGIQIGVSNEVLPFLEARFSADFSNNEIDYQGHTQSGMPHTTTTKQAFKNIAISLLYSISYQDLSIKPLIEFQRRKWLRAIQAKGNVSSLTEHYRWDEWSFGLSLAHPLWLGEVTLSTKKLLTRNGDLRVDIQDPSPQLALGNDDGFAIELAYKYPITLQQSISLSVFYKEWHFSKGKAETINTLRGPITIFEPRSISKTNGISIEYKYAI